MTVCAWCELELDTSDRQSIRLASSQPPWTARSAFGAAGVVAAAGQEFAGVLRAMGGREPEIVVWFHRDCWHKLRGLLKAVR